MPSSAQMSRYQHSMSVSRMRHASKWRIISLRPTHIDYLIISADDLLRIALPAIDLIRRGSVLFTHYIEVQC